MPPPTQAILDLARTHIDAARDARGVKGPVIKHYRTAKRVLATIDAAKADAPTLSEIIAAFQELAVVLDNSGVQLQKEAEKCRKRAESLQ